MTVRRKDQLSANRGIADGRVAIPRMKTASEKRNAPVIPRCDGVLPEASRIPKASSIQPRTWNKSANHPQKYRKTGTQASGVIGVRNAPRNSTPLPTQRVRESVARLPAQLRGPSGPLGASRVGTPIGAAEGISRYVP